MGLYTESLFDNPSSEKPSKPALLEPVPLAPSEPAPLEDFNDQDLTNLRNALGSKAVEYEVTLQEIEEALSSQNYGQAIHLVDLLEELVDLALC